MNQLSVKFDPFCVTQIQLRKIKLKYSSFLRCWSTQHTLTAFHQNKTRFSIEFCSLTSHASLCCPVVSCIYDVMPYVSWRKNGYRHSWGERRFGKFARLWRHTDSVKRVSLSSEPTRIFHLENSNILIWSFSTFCARDAKRVKLYA